MTSSCPYSFLGGIIGNKDEADGVVGWSAIAVVVPAAAAAAAAAAVLMSDAAVLMGAGAATTGGLDRRKGINCKTVAV